MATTHNTATVKIRLDLGELITQLRNLADTLETTQKPKTDDEPEDTGECTHEAWDVHPNGITRHCSDCRETLPDLTPEPKRVIIDEFFAGSVDPELVAAATRQARRKLAHAVDFPCCAPEPANFTDGTKPARNPHTLDLPDGLDPAEAQHMLDVIADAQSGRTAPVLIRVAASSDLDPQPLRCPQCDDPWHPRAICPTCGCDHRRADYGADPR